MRGELCVTGWVVKAGEARTTETEAGPLTSGRVASTRTFEIQSLTPASRVAIEGLLAVLDDDDGRRESSPLLSFLIHTIRQPLAIDASDRSQLRLSTDSLANVATARDTSVCLIVSPPIERVRLTLAGSPFLDAHVRLFARAF